MQLKQTQIQVKRPKLVKLATSIMLPEEVIKQLEKEARLNGHKIAPYIRHILENTASKEGNYGKRKKT